ncbi:MAG: C45 family autoproteolytic acyltransferase/hydrolase [Rhodothermaceae bacterium]
MKKIFVFLFSFVIIHISFAGNEIKVTNSGFEKISNQQAIGWKADNKTISVSSAQFHSGSKSIKINHSNWNQSTLVSEEVDLKVGHLYKLSGWVKTSNAVTKEIKRYPTSVAGCLTMESMPFTNHSPSAGGTYDWQKIEMQFIATKAKDKIRLHFGYNGNAKGEIFFDDIELSEVDDITSFIEPETVKWFDKGFRYDDKGWIFVHIEGKPYERGYQYGYLVAKEIEEMIRKISVSSDRDKPSRGWHNKRYAADAMMLRKFEEEYLEEMKGIADGVAKTGIKIHGSTPDLLDIVTLNCDIDIDYSSYALRKTPNQLSSKSFLAQEDELCIPEKLHKCSAFLANNSATKDGGIVFGQIFMWGGYTGPHWNVITDVVPEKGNRLVYQTYPGGIHSGADFYMNSAGIMLGETTVSQTPFNVDGKPMSNRIRKAAQYANSIDDVAEILADQNNGMYTNDWLIGDTKTNEIAIFLLGTYTNKLWRSSKNEFYGDSKDWYWSNNNNKSMKVRKELISNKNNSPVDLVFRPHNRDIAFQEFYKNHYGKIDAVAGVNLWASSPINRPHACDGKITTSEMAKNMVFLAHYGKVTLREKFVGENNRVPDLPGAVPRLSLGYAVASPVFIADKLKEYKQNKEKEVTKKINLKDVKDNYTFEKRNLWRGTVYPKTDKANWFNSATASYWNLLNRISSNGKRNFKYVTGQLNGLSARYSYLTLKEGTLKPVDARTDYNQYKFYQIPRIRGTFLLHQLRLTLGDKIFTDAMNEIHNKFAEKEITTKEVKNIFEDKSDKNLSAIFSQWLERNDLPEIKFEASAEKSNDKFVVKIKTDQKTKYDFITTVCIETEKSKIVKQINIDKKRNSFEFEVKEKPVKVVFNASKDMLLKEENCFTWSNFFDDFSNVMFVYGTSRQIEANHTLAKRFSLAAADRYTETLCPVIKDSEITEEQLKSNDLVILGGTEDNMLMKKMCEQFGIKVGKNIFEFNGKVYGSSEDGFFAAFPNPFNKKKTVYLYNANSALQLHQMTKRVHRMNGWSIFKNAKIIKSGYHKNERFEVKL